MRSKRGIITRDYIETHFIDPVLLVEKTQGKMAEDHKWLEII